MRHQYDRKSDQQMRVQNIHKRDPGEKGRILPMELRTEPEPERRGLLAAVRHKSVI